MQFLFRSRSISLLLLSAFISTQAMPIAVWAQSSRDRQEDEYNKGRAGAGIMPQALWEIIMRGEPFPASTPAGAPAAPAAPFVQGSNTVPPLPPAPTPTAPSWNPFAVPDPSLTLPVETATNYGEVKIWYQAHGDRLTPSQTVDMLEMLQRKASYEGRGSIPAEITLYINNNLRTLYSRLQDASPLEVFPASTRPALPFTIPRTSQGIISALRDFFISIKEAAHAKFLPRMAPAHQEVFTRTQQVPVPFLDYIRVLRQIMTQGEYDTFIDSGSIADLVKARIQAIVTPQEYQGLEASRFRDSATLTALVQRVEEWQRYMTAAEQTAWASNRDLAPFLEQGRMHKLMTSAEWASLQSTKTVPGGFWERVQGLRVVFKAVGQEALFEVFWSSGDMPPAVENALKPNSGQISEMTQAEWDLFQQNKEVPRSYDQRLKMGLRPREYTGAPQLSPEYVGRIMGAIRNLSYRNLAFYKSPDAMKRFFDYFVNEVNRDPSLGAKFMQAKGNDMVEVRAIFERWMQASEPKASLTPEVLAQLGNKLPSISMEEFLRQPGKFRTLCTAYPKLSTTVVGAASNIALYNGLDPLVAAVWYQLFNRSARKMGWDAAWDKAVQDRLTPGALAVSGVSGSVISLAVRAGVKRLAVAKASAVPVVGGIIAAIGAALIAKDIAGIKAELDRITEVAQYFQNNPRKVQVVFEKMLKLYEQYPPKREYGSGAWGVTSAYAAGADAAWNAVVGYNEEMLRAMMQQFLTDEVTTVVHLENFMQDLHPEQSTTITMETLLAIEQLAVQVRNLKRDEYVREVLAATKKLQAPLIRTVERVADLQAKQRDMVGYSTNPDLWIKKKTLDYQYELQQRYAQQLVREQPLRWLLPESLQRMMTPLEGIEKAGEVWAQKNFYSKEARENLLKYRQGLEVNLQATLKQQRASVIDFSPLFLYGWRLQEALDSLLTEKPNVQKATLWEVMDVQEKAVRAKDPTMDVGYFRNHLFAGEEGIKIFFAMLHSVARILMGQDGLLVDVRNALQARTAELCTQKVPPERALSILENPVRLEGQATMLPTTLNGKQGMLLVAHVSTNGEALQQATVLRVKLPLEAVPFGANAGTVSVTDAVARLSSIGAPFILKGEAAQECTWSPAADKQGVVCTDAQGVLGQEGAVLVAFVSYKSAAKNSPYLQAFLSASEIGVELDGGAHAQGMLSVIRLPDTGVPLEEEQIWDAIK